MAKLSEGPWLGGIVKADEVPFLAREPTAETVAGCGVICWMGTIYASPEFMARLTVSPDDGRASGRAWSHTARARPSVLMCKRRL